MAHDSSSIHWQAFCYFHDELSAEERASFDVLLAESQEAREALAEVVELSLAVVEGQRPVIERPVAAQVIPQLAKDAPRLATSERNGAGAKAHGVGNGAGYCVANGTSNGGTNGGTLRFAHERSDSRRMLWGVAGAAAAVIAGAVLWIVVPHGAPVVRRPSELEPGNQPHAKQGHIKHGISDLGATEESRVELAMLWAEMEKDSQETSEGVTDSASGDDDSSDASHDTSRASAEDSSAADDRTAEDRVIDEPVVSDSGDSVTDSDPIAPRWILIAVAGPDVDEDMDGSSDKDATPDHELK